MGAKPDVRLSAHHGRAARSAEWSEAEVAPHNPEEQPAGTAAAPMHPDDRNRASITGEIDLIFRDPTNRVEHNLNGVSAVPLPLGSRCMALDGVKHRRIDACSPPYGLEAMSSPMVRIAP
jgi:hypothetical protein